MTNFSDPRIFFLTCVVAPGLAESIVRRAARSRLQLRVGERITASDRNAGAAWTGVAEGKDLKSNECIALILVKTSERSPRTNEPSAAI